MGATAADTKREIEEIRKDVSSAVSELRGRVMRVVSPQTYLDFARENPAAILGVGLGAREPGGYRGCSECRRNPASAASVRAAHARRDGRGRESV